MRRVTTRRRSTPRDGKSELYEPRRAAAYLLSLSLSLSPLLNHLPQSVIPARTKRSIESIVRGTVTLEQPSLFDRPFGYRAARDD
jgi:hypothetical protein